MPSTCSSDRVSPGLCGCLVERGVPVPEVLGEVGQVAAVIDRRHVVRGAAVADAREVGVEGGAGRAEVDVADGAGARAAADGARLARCAVVARTGEWREVGRLHAGRGGDDAAPALAEEPDLLGERSVTAAGHRRPVAERGVRVDGAVRLAVGAAQVHLVAREPGRGARHHDPVRGVGVREIPVEVRHERGCRARDLRRGDHGGCLAGQHEDDDQHERCDQQTAGHRSFRGDRGSTARFA